MSQQIFSELENRQHEVEKRDLESRSRNLEQFRTYWLHITILSSAIVLGVLPLISENSTLIRSATLAKLGLGIIIFVCVAAILYLQNVLARERDLLAERRVFHEEVFAKQRGALEAAQRDGQDSEFLKGLFERTKTLSHSTETGILMKHLLGRRTLFLDKYFTPLTAYTFAFGVLLVVFSFIL
ncbi:hypothetical protein A3G63_00245 [Candidatus Kaiserbacteria bacterium RIFCSPLOWO2_12_FULL_52_8]|nr:MAG: hypothetical protein A3G63_00245 [Candidatus Kaiserbacteria bacterium RIFCSPLOWO2_12_FULL_52_8]